jgi:hypothetical protein
MLQRESIEAARAATRNTQTTLLPWGGHGYVQVIYAKRRLTLNMHTLQDRGYVISLEGFAVCCGSTWITSFVEKDAVTRLRCVNRDITDKGLKLLKGLADLTVGQLAPEQPITTQWAAVVPRLYSQYITSFLREFHAVKRT